MKRETMFKYSGLILFAAFIVIVYSSRSSTATQQVFSGPVSEDSSILRFDYSQLKFEPLASAIAMPVSQTVNVTLEEWKISPDQPSVSSGNVTFVVNNIGPGDKHEFVVFKTELAPDALPSDSKGVDENGPGLKLIGEIEDIAVEANPARVSFDLNPGNYVLLCNIWDEAEQESHYHKGMRIAFTVNKLGARMDKSNSRHI